MTYAVDRPVPCTWPEDGPQPVDIVIVGEAPGADEARIGHPFVGASGRMLTSWLKSAGIDRERCLVTNVFSYKPVQNNVGQFFIKRREAAAVKKETGWESPHPPYGTNGFLQPEHEYELNRLADEIDQANPNVIIALGATALWALTQQEKISAKRGTLLAAMNNFGNRKVLPTYHPAAILRNWENRVFVHADFQKAKLESKSPDVTRTEREIWMEPTLEDLAEFANEHLTPLENTGQPIAFDIETGHDEITCIGFAPTPEVAIVVPFYDGRKENCSYWDTPEQEEAAWLWVKSVMENSKLVKLAHNSNYDNLWLAKRMGIKLQGGLEDTMHLHHALQPELPKALGVLGSVYTNEAAWKDMVSHGKKRGNKRDE